MRAENHLPCPASYTSLDAAQDVIGFLGCKHALLAHTQLFIHQYPPSPSVQGCSQSTHHPACIHVVELPQPRSRTRHLALLNFMRFTWTYLLSLSLSLWIASLPSSTLTASLSLMLSANLLRMYPTPLPMSRTKMLNNTRCYIIIHKASKLVLRWLNSLW